MTNTTVAAVKEAIQSFLKAYASNNLDEVRKWSSGELTFGHASGRAETQQEFMKGLAGGKTTAYSDIVPVDQRITLIDNVAVVHQTIRRTRTDGLTRMDTEMVVLMLKDGRWRLVSRQGVKVNGNGFS